jgi:hypothetical protein
MLGNRRPTYTLSTLVTLMFSTPLPVAEIIIGSLHKHDYGCDSFVGVSDWLIIKGATMLGLVFFGLLMFGATNYAAVTNSNKSAVFGAFFWFLHSISIAFQSAWLIVGSVMFWRDCRHVTPSSVNSMMWASLIIGYANAVVVACKSKST